MSDDGEVEVPDYVPVNFGLPDTGSIKQCPKCGADPVATVYEFHLYGIQNGPCGRAFPLDVDLRSLGEHICRMCISCQYAWPERARNT